MKTYIVIYFDTLEGAHQVYKIVEEDHNKALAEGYKRYNPDWKNEDDNSLMLREDYYMNAEVVAVIDAPMNAVELTFHNLVYEIPRNPQDDIDPV